MNIIYIHRTSIFKPKVDFITKWRRVSKYFINQATELTHEGCEDFK